jgi:hypothetical protein
VLVLKMEMSGLLTLAGPALRFLDALPPGVRVERDRIYVDVKKLLEVRGAARYLEYVNALQVNTRDGSVVVSIGASIKA